MVQEPENSKPGEMQLALPAPAVEKEWAAPKRCLPLELRGTKVEIRDSIEGRMAIRGVIREMNDSYLVLKGQNGEAFYVSWTLGLIIHPMEF